MFLTEDFPGGVRYLRFLVPKISEFLYLLVKTGTNKVLNRVSVSLSPVPLPHSAVEPQVSKSFFCY